MKSDELKQLVKEKYSEIAESQKGEGCCGTAGCCSGTEYSTFNESYEKLDGYNPDADLSLGCGIPTEYAMIKQGDTVVDLGSGAGNDCFVARALTGESGKVTGVDMTPAMIDKARLNCRKLGFTNVEFVQGDIENIPLESNIADVIISNCVLNLVPDKVKAFTEIYRILRPGGHLSVSDVVLRGDLPEKLKEAAVMYAGCVSGAIDINFYLELMGKAGLKNIKVQKEKIITLPDDTLLEYLDKNELAEFTSSGTGIFSVTIYAEKPV
jgi:arsenite methyltransferase